MMDGRGKAGDGGFTLVELLVVIVILSLIVTALTSGVRFAGRAWETEERLLERQGDLSAVQTVLRQMIMSGHDFEGDAGSLRFVGTLPRALDRGGLFDLRIHTTNDRMVLAWRPHFKGAKAAEDETETTLVEGISDLEIYFFEPDAAGGAGEWVQTPSDTSKPPTLIRIALTLASGRAWTPLIVAPAIEGESTAPKPPS